MKTSSTTASTHVFVVESPDFFASIAFADDAFADDAFALTLRFDCGGVSPVSVSASTTAARARATFAVDFGGGTRTFLLFPFCLFFASERACSLARFFCSVLRAPSFAASFCSFFARELGSGIRGRIEAFVRKLGLRFFFLFFFVVPTRVERIHARVGQAERISRLIARVVTRFQIPIELVLARRGDGCLARGGCTCGFLGRAFQACDLFCEGSSSSLSRCLVHLRKKP